MSRFILLILIIGMLAFVGHATVADHHDHRIPHAAKTKKAHKEPKAKKGHERHKPKEADAEPRAPQAEPKIRTIVGRVSATEERARADAFRELETEVSQWLEPDVPASWNPERRQLNDMIVGVKITPTEKPYGTVYTAELEADFSDARRAELIRSYERVAVHDRLLKLGGLLVFILICLAAVSGFIRADEATKGYHTNRLRLLAAAGVGAAGVLIYQLFT